MQDNIINEVCRLLRILSNKDTMKIFIESNLGLDASTDTPTRLGMNRKQYYIGLRQLKDAGLVTKNEGKYVQTIMGRTLYKRLLPLITELLKERTKLSMADTLMKSGRFSIDEIYSALQIDTTDE